MDKRLEECINNTNKKEYILPFFWQHGEDHEILLREIEAMASCGIDQFCVESRVHEDFGTDKWWEDLGFILEEAGKRNMRVWLLDDKRFPTGYANNFIEAHQELRAVHLRMELRDFAGPARNCAILPVNVDNDEQIVSIVAYRRDGKDGEKMVGDGIQLLSMLKDGLLWWNVPDGLWRIYYLIRTHRTVEKLWDIKKYFVDPMNPESCKAMLTAVYEPHYEHFCKYFGNTFAGFFSDEPGFSNDDKTYFSILGKEDMMLPWNDGLPEHIAQRLNVSKEKVMMLLPALWHQVNNEAAELRISFMDAVTDFFAKNFTGMLGNWCREHGVEYIGHIIEDDNAHQRLGCGAGHFFKALKPMDMAGCDIVLHQIIPGYLSMPHAYAGYGTRCNEPFFRYALPKLAASLAHIDPQKRGRTMCEIFGAFGWSEGIPEMKYLADYMLVGGINHFVPHAFSPKFPDQDCPPHFYKGGHNVQFVSFSRLMDYMQKMSYLLSDGVHCADVAVYYNCEAEWSGKDRMLQQDVCMALTRNQIDFDIIPQDTLCEEAKCENGKLLINKETYGAIAVPYSQYLPKRVIETLNTFNKCGVPVVYVNNMPENAAAVGFISTLDALPEFLRRMGLCSFNIKKITPTLRYFHITRDGEDIYMLWNEDSIKSIDTTITVSHHGNAILSDMWHGKTFKAQQDENGIRIKLAPSQAIVMTFGDDELPMFDYCDDKLSELVTLWRISRLKEDGTEEYLGTELKNYAPMMPKFAGKLIYEASFSFGNKLELGTFGEIAQVWVNGNFVGTSLTQNERIDISKFVKRGENKLRIEITVNQGYEGRDRFSTFTLLPPMGLLGPVCSGI